MTEAYNSIWRGLDEAEQIPSSEVHDRVGQLVRPFRVSAQLLSVCSGNNVLPPSLLSPAWHYYDR